ncbi:DUF2235 domain-containing protein [Sphingorhabdus sp. YGSMI21]|uniref:DUF2235 domain-containing protein n=1 Tax=Sphingorhabdus sp. YGSMI21 TaxID=2077182 RepID=UPI000C1DFEA9|nr:DUF2235 domain-containing protein [Sphingorhabdus sp. YGSMI21]ATW03162.1 hypothetical protein CHN51_06110 [Sphingorhabdus sp. YGSMI21]
MMKKLAFCFDGTWNKVTSGFPSNVSKIARAIEEEHAGSQQTVFYDEGVGTHELGNLTGKLVNKISGALGFGLQQNVIEAYTFLILNYQPGDEIYVFGFSRGAFTARSFVGLIRNVGILPKRRLFNIREVLEQYRSRSPEEHPSSFRSCELRYKLCPHLLLPGDAEWRSKLDTKYDGNTTELSISYLGVWDTVGALGLPKRLGLSKAINRKYQFHDTRLSGFVKAARHAVAADEMRRTFEPALWTNLQELNSRSENKKYLQKIFPGTHSAVGGGGPHVGLSDGPLEWIYKGAREAGLGFDTALGSPLFGLLPDHRAPLFNEEGKYGWSIGDKFLGAGLRPRNFSSVSIEQIDETINRRWHDPNMENSGDGNYRPASLMDWHDYIKSSPPKTNIDLDEEIFDGICHNNRDLRTPKSVKTYIVQATDRWPDIAEKFGYARDFWKAIFLFNFDACRVYKPEELYASREILIPIY